jgi:carotenoid cleavage dioxygenase
VSQAGTHDELLRFDLARGTITGHHFPGHAISEAVFAPMAGCTEEDAGYLVAFATDLVTNESRFVILDAADISAEPVASIKLPQRVPDGLHGNWYPTDGLSAKSADLT